MKKNHLYPNAFIHVIIKGIGLYDSHLVCGLSGFGISVIIAFRKFFLPCSLHCLHLPLLAAYQLLQKSLHFLSGFFVVDTILLFALNVVPSVIFDFVYSC